MTHADMSCYVMFCKFWLPCHTGDWSINSQQPVAQLKPLVITFTWPVGSTELFCALRAAVKHSLVQPPPKPRQLGLAVTSTISWPVTWHYMELSLNLHAYVCLYASVVDTVTQIMLLTNASHATGCRAIFTLF